ncbi:MAG: hypothetical protein ACKOX2_16415 [Microcystaceae cyanobacterium]
MPKILMQRRSPLTRWIKRICYTGAILKMCFLTPMPLWIKP